MSQPPDPDNTPPQPSRYGFKPPEAVVAGIFLGVAFTALAALVLSGAEIWTLAYWSPEGDRSGVARNLGLLSIALPALWLAWRRTGTASKQAETAERGLIIDRYQKGAVMLESDELSVRIAGVFALRELALSDPDETYFLALDVLYAFVREKSKTRQRLEASPAQDDTGDTSGESYCELGTDLSEALEAATFLRNTVNKAKSREVEKRWKPNLDNANLSRAFLCHANLFDADLFLANLSGAMLNLTNLSGANLARANLSGAHLKDVQIDAGTDLYDIWAYADNPPQNMPDKISEAIAYRQPGEDWDEFKTRMRRERKR